MGGEGGPSGVRDFGVWIVKQPFQRTDCVLREGGCNPQHFACIIALVLVGALQLGELSFYMRYMFGFHGL
jgi:hypothetical protein